MTVPPSPVWAFTDETGDVGRAAGSSHYLIVAVVLTRTFPPLPAYFGKTLWLQKDQAASSKSASENSRARSAVGRWPSTGDVTRR